MANMTTSKRARLGPAPGAMQSILGDPSDPAFCESLMQPLWATKGVLFPYTPDVMFGGAANYQSWHFTHSNYQQFQFQNSTPSEIQLVGTFTAQTNEEARYMLAVMRFLRVVTMLEFGIKAVERNVAGTPPPVLRFNYMGAHMFNNVPVVLQNYNYQLDRDVDYVEVILPGTNNSNLRTTSRINETIFGELPVKEDRRTYVPTRMMITLMLGVQQNPRNTRDEFDLEKFKRGDLINKGFL